MLSRLARLRDGAELTAIASIKRRADDYRQVRYAVAAGFVSAVAVPPSLILAYLSTNAAQVNGNLSMFCYRCFGIHLTVAGVVPMGALLFLGRYIQQRREARDQCTSGQRSRWKLARLATA